MRLKFSAKKIDFSFFSLSGINAIPADIQPPGTERCCLYTRIRYFTVLEFPKTENLEVQCQTVAFLAEII